MIAERGIDGLSLRALARRLGATTGLVTHHFLDRAELVEAALDHASDVVIGRVMAIEPPVHPLDVLAAVLPTDDETVENWRFALSVRTAALFDPALRRFDRTITNHWESNIPQHLRGHVAGDPLTATRHLIALVDGIALRAVLDPQSWPPDAQLAHLRAGFAALSDLGGNQ